MISSTATYALQAVIYLAGQPGGFVNRSEISDATCVPHEYLLKVLHLLDNAGIVESRRGPGGGYRLRKPASELTSLEVVLAVDSIPGIRTCASRIAEHNSMCPLYRLLDEAAKRVEAAFADVKISELLPREHAKHGDVTKPISSHWTGVDA